MWVGEVWLFNHSKQTKKRRRRTLMWNKRDWNSINTLPTYRWIWRMRTQWHHARLTRWHSHWHPWAATLLAMHQLVVTKQWHIHQTWIRCIENCSIFTPSSTVHNKLKSEEKRNARKKVYFKMACRTLLSIVYECVIWFFLLIVFIVLVRDMLVFFLATLHHHYKKIRTQHWQM